MRINTYMYMQLYIHELSVSNVCIKYTYIAYCIMYIHICVLVEFSVSFVVTF